MCGMATTKCTFEAGSRWQIDLASNTAVRGCNMNLMVWKPGLCWADWRVVAGAPMRERPASVLAFTDGIPLQFAGAILLLESAAL